jgi:hypothetical protein
VDITHGEMAENQFDILIERRSRKGEVDPEEREEGWQESVRRFNEKRRQMARFEWHAFHCGQAARHRATLQALVDHDEGQAAKLMEDQPKGAA